MEWTSCGKVLVLASVILASLAAGCGGLTGAAEPMWTWRKPELLYLLSDSYDRLYVEVDTIEGVQPPADSLASLKQLLEQYCDKPAGIRIVRDRPIPLEQARGKPPHLLALLNIDGPQAAEAADRTAYLYVLFFDSRRLGLRQVENPHVDRYYPCAIYVDMAYWPEILSKAVDDGRKSAAYPWCLQSTEFQQGKGYATCNRLQQRTRF